MKRTPQEKKRGGAEVAGALGQGVLMFGRPAQRPERGRLDRAKNGLFIWKSTIDLPPQRD
jgi:hypothetical protein